MLSNAKQRLSNYKSKVLACFKFNLPEQRYFSIEQLLLRWGTDGVTFQHLCDWVENDNFVMGVRVRDTSNISEQIDQADGGVLTRTTSSMVLVGAKPPPIRTDYLGVDTLVKILTAAPGVKVRADVTYAASSRDKGYDRDEGKTYTYPL